MRTRIPLTLALGLSLALAAFAQQPAAGEPDTKRPRPYCTQDPLRQAHAEF